jgi:hypothetical protein
MSRSTIQIRWILGFLAVLAVLVGCAVYRPAEYLGLAPYRAHRADVPETRWVGGPRVDHVAHVDRGLDCTDCHEVDDETGEPGMPTLETCMGCHEDIDEDKPDAEKVSLLFFDDKEQPRWTRALLALDEELKFAHKAHAEAGECGDCHGTMAATPQGRPARLLFDMDGCMRCHAEKSVSNQCGTCHSLLDVGVAPPSHSYQWKIRHGDAATLGRHTATANRCDMCHAEPQDCDRCHQVEAPRSHRRLWTQRHGQIVRAAGGDLPAQCAFCHRDRSYCEKCHLDEKPRSHTALFRTRTHGVLASLDRRSCQTCHRTDFCRRCHEETAPRSHRAGWDTGRNTHCVQCHFPISSTPGCAACHRANPVHATAPPQPPGHIPGRNCRVCHNPIGGGGAPPLRHLDNGQNCESCHR